MTYTLLERILNISTEGCSPTIHSKRKATLRLILGKEEVSPLEIVTTNQLSVEMRLLHSIIGHILFPKTGRFDFVSERDLIIMHCVLEKIPINLPKLMISYMIEASTKSQASLSYGMILTILFKEFRVPINKNKPKKILRHTNIYNM